MDVTTPLILLEALALVGICTFIWFGPESKRSRTTQGVAIFAAILLLAAFAASIFLYVPR